MFSNLIIALVIVHTHCKQNLHLHFKCSYRIGVGEQARGRTGCAKCTFEHANRLWEQQQLPVLWYVGWHYPVNRRALWACEQCILMKSNAYLFLYVYWEFKFLIHLICLAYASQLLMPVYRVSGDRHSLALLLLLRFWSSFASAAGEHREHIPPQPQFRPRPRPFPIQLTATQRTQRKYC